MVLNHAPWLIALVSQRFNHREDRLRGTDVAWVGDAPRAVKPKANEYGLDHLGCRKPAIPFPPLLGKA